MRFSIMLIVLIVVVVSASVILYVNYMKSRNTIITTSPDLNMTGIYKLGLFASSCENMCKRGDIFSFCTAKFTGDVDVNRNGMIDSIKTVSGFNACEDGIYCMHAYQCKFKGEILNPKDCKNILCSAYEKLYDNNNKASQVVIATFPGKGSCNLTDQGNWWLVEGFGPQPPCG